MNGMPVHSWPHLSAVANWLATYWIHSSLVLGAAWLLDRSVLRRPRLVEAVWKFALVAGLITATLQSALGIRPLGGQRPLPWIAPATAAVARPELAPAQPELAPAPPVRVSAAPRPRRPAAVLPLAVRTDRHPSEVAPALAPAAAPARAAKPASAVAVVSARPEVPLALVLFIGAWGLGGAIALAGLARSWHRFRRRLSGRAEVADGGTRATLRALCRVAGRRRAVRLTRCSSVDVPLAMGVHRHEICVPERALAELDGERIEALLAHELAHVTRRDPAWVLLLNVIGRAFFLQPLHWLAARRLAACSELACDDLAAQWTQRPLALARCLADVAG
ncbi:MAG TPA: M56 family metallopeptidase, partial [Polyangia bacterium]|nr:M56 family metallopeptidase [Polyangia bacterium]